MPAPEMPDSVPVISPLIGVAELAQALGSDDPPVLLDVRWRLGGPPGVDSYLAGHLPGAVYIDLDRQLAAAPGPDGRHPLPPAGDFEQVMRAAGVRDECGVVVCDDGDATIAARAWWMLRYYGHSNVRVLDGGFRAWARAGEAVSTESALAEPGSSEAPAAAPGDFTARPGQMPVLDAAGAAQIARSGVLLDARAPARYRGETEPVDRVAGHIPGAVSAPTAANVNSGGVFLPAAELRARFADLGVAAAAEGAGPDGQEVGAYCGSGVTAAHEVLALEVAGVPAALYVGSWSGWVADPGRPVATGPQPG
jgi:thiosulfate/3-mercaptopyruvate sulfurtransferase